MNTRTGPARSDKRRTTHQTVEPLLAGLAAIGLAMVLWVGATAEDGAIPFGSHDGQSGVATSISQCGAFGWAVDPDDQARELQVQILSDGNVVTTVTANQERRDVEACPDGTCGFGAELWGLISPGIEHEITAQALDQETDTWVNLPGTPKSLTCWGYPFGWHDGSAGEVTTTWECSAFGWAVDPDNRERDLQVQILADDIPVAEVTADLLREGLEECPGGTCGFGVNLWGLISPGVEHMIMAQALDVETSTWFDLSGTPKSLTCWGYPEGFHDGAEGVVDRYGCTAFGWAADPENRDRDIQVQILADNELVATTTADQLRPDVTACVGGTCGFSVDLWGLISPDLEHWITAQAYDLETDQWLDLQATPKRLTCTAPAQPSPSVWISTSNDYFRGNDFTPGGTLTLQVYETEGSANLILDVNMPIPDTGFAFLDGWEHGVDLVVGNYVVASDGTYTRTLVLEPLTIDVFDPGTDFVAGTATPGESVHVVIGNNDVGYPPEGEMTVYADQNGNWTANYAETFDIPWDMWASAEVPDEDWDWTVFHRGPTTEPPPNPWLIAFPENEAVDTWEWPDGATVYLSIDDPATEASPDYSTSAVVSPTPWGDPRTYAHFEFAYDLKPGDQVTATDGGTPRTHVVQDLRDVVADGAEDTVSGIAPVGATVQVWPHETGELLEDEADSEGYWRVDFTGVRDLEPGVGGRSQIVDAEGNATAVDWSVPVPPSPWFTAFPETDFIEGFEWPMGSTVHLTIEDPNTEASPDLAMDDVAGPSPWEGDTRTYVSYDLVDPFDLKPGDEITLTDGVTMRTMVVQNLAIADVDVVNDTVTGTADQGAAVYVWPHATGVQVEAEWENGAWIAALDHDIVPGSAGRAEIRDDLYNGTAVDWYAPNPHFVVFPEWEALELWEWPDGTMVEVTIDDPDTTQSPDFNDSYTIDADEGGPSFHAWISLGSAFDMGPGDMVEVAGTTGVRTHTIYELAITSVDKEADAITGTCAPGETVHVWPHADGEKVATIEECPGEWVADFSSLYDIQQDSSGQAEIRDTDGDATAVEWAVAWFTAFPEYDQVEGWNWQLGSTVHMTIDDPAVDGAVNFTKDGQVVLAPWGSGQDWLWIELGGEYDLKAGDIVTLSDGRIERVHVVRDLSITAASPDDNRVYGAAPAGSYVVLWSWEDPEGRRLEATADHKGLWAADFDDVGFDLEPGYNVRAEIWDDDGNDTAVDREVRSPRIAVYLEGEFVIGWDWPRGADVRMTIDDPATRKKIDYKANAEVEPAPWDPSVWWVEIDFTKKYNVKPGDVVVLTDGTNTREHVVLPLTVGAIDAEADTVTGTSNPGATVYVHPWEALFDPVAADDHGGWEMSFAGQYDLLPGTWGIAETFDANGNSTAIDWVVPLPIQIDIQPWSRLNPVACRLASAWLPVAVLSDEGFDSTQLLSESLRFGKTGTEAAVVRTGKGKLPLQYSFDVNRDGYLDMVYTFRLGDTGFGCSDIPAGQQRVTLQGTLTGSIEAGPVEGTDSITLLRLSTH